MLNKCAGQGSNDEFKHLIQVNARKFNLFRHDMKYFWTNKEKLFFFGSLNLPVSGSVGEWRKGL